MCRCQNRKWYCTNLTKSPWSIWLLKLLDFQKQQLDSPQGTHIYASGNSHHNNLLNHWLANHVDCFTQKHPCSIKQQRLYHTIDKFYVFLCCTWLQTIASSIMCNSIQDITLPQLGDLLILSCINLKVLVWSAVFTVLRIKFWHCHILEPAEHVPSLYLSTELNLPFVFWQVSQACS